MQGRILKLMRTGLIWAACAFAAAMLIFAPIELNAVRSVRHWQPVAAHFVTAGYKRVPLDDGGGVYAFFTVRDRLSDKEIEIRDIRPGDFPFKIEFLGWPVFDTSKAVMNAYARRSDITVWRSPDGRKYVLEQGHYGLMTALLILSLLWWGAIGFFAWKRRQA